MRIVHFALFFSSHCEYEDPCPFFEEVAPRQIPPSSRWFRQCRWNNLWARGGLGDRSTWYQDSAALKTSGVEVVDGVVDSVERVRPRVEIHLALRG
jgi:hypothetical protein